MSEMIPSKTNAPRLAMIVGVVYIVIGLIGLANYFLEQPINFFRLFFYVSIGIGMFEKHAWSRTLGIITSATIVISGFLFIMLRGKVLWNDSPVSWGIWYAIGVTGVNFLLLYILLRKDVKSLFVAKEN